MNKMNLGLVFGGKSAEHDVSIMSTTSVLEVIDHDRYQIQLFYITKQGHWYLVDDLNTLPDKEKKYPLGPDILKVLYEQSVILPIIHGPHGEDGSLQGLFESLEIPYVGSKVLGSAVCMDKIISKKIMRHAGIDTVEFFELYTSLTDDKMMDLKKWIKAYPVFVKPSNMGSSVGIAKVHNENELESALTEALKYDSRVLIEAGVEAREIECAVLESKGLHVSGVGEVLASNDFYDYDAKYIDDGQEKMAVPAEGIDEVIVETIRATAKKAFLEHGCSGLARVDFFVEKETNRVILNELNTLPGMTAFSMYPLLFEEKGIHYKQLLNQLIDQALDL